MRREHWWTPGQGEHEVTFAINLRTLELREYSGEDRDVWKAAHSPDWLTGTIDWLGPSGVDDLKTGSWPVHADTSKQLRSYALLPWFRASRPSGFDIIASITQWPKYPIAGLPRRTSYILDTFDLAEQLDGLQYALDHPDEVNASDEGCRFCDCKRLCPAWVDEDTEVELGEA